VRWAPNALGAAMRRARGLVGWTHGPLGAEDGRLSAIERSGWRLASAILVGLSVMAVAVGLATRYDALPALLVGLLIAFGVVAGMRWPSLLLYAYVASLPVNFVLPPGPASTAAPRARVPICRSGAQTRQGPMPRTRRGEPRCQSRI